MRSERPRPSAPCPTLSARTPGPSRPPRPARIAGVAALLALVASAPASAQPEAPPAPVVVERAEMRSLAPVIWYPGTIMSRHDARLAAEVEGRVIEVAEVGTRVQPGDVVARLDDTLFRQELSEAQAAVAREQARLAYLEHEVERLSRLATENNVAQSQLDQAVSNRGVTRSELAAMRTRVERARERLARTVVRAPFPGVVSERFVQVGEWAESGAAVVRLVDTGALEVQTRVPAKILAHIQVGSALRMQASPERASAEVRAIVPVGDDRSRLYELRLELAESPWPAGQSIRVAVPTAAPREVVAVHRDALVLRREGTSVFRIRDDDTAERVEVTPGIAAGDYIEVQGGIRPGDRVVVRGGERLRSGQKVQILPALTGSS